MTQADRSWEAHLALYAAADSLFRDGKRRLALREFRNALLLAPGDVDTLWAIADCYSHLGKPHKAAQFYRRARTGATWQKRGDLLYNIANALLDQRRPLAAIRLYRLVPRSASSYGQARRNCLRACALLANRSLQRTATPPAELER